MLARREQGSACIEVFSPTQSQITSFFHWKKATKSLPAIDLAFMLSPCISCKTVERTPVKNRADDKLSPGAFAETGRLSAHPTSLDFPMPCLPSYSIGPPHALSADLQDPGAQRRAAALGQALLSVFCWVLWLVEAVDNHSNTLPA